MAVEKNVKGVKCKHGILNCDSKPRHGIITRGKLVSKDHVKCKECEKQFGNYQNLKIHVQVQQVNDEHVGDRAVYSEVSDSPLRHPVAPMISGEDHNASSVSTENTGAQGSSSVSAKKGAGLTKVRLEDCLRCDACSCIYLDEVDYHKHMRNFHHKIPKKSKGGHGKKCRSCCKNCKCSNTSSRQTCITQLADACRLPFDIKDRWKKLMNCAEKKTDHTDFPVKVKLEPDDTYDYSHLLSQVEVSIKTEPDC